MTASLQIRHNCPENARTLSNKCDNREFGKFALGFTIRYSPIAEKAGKSSQARDVRGGSLGMDAILCGQTQHFASFIN